MKVGQPVVLKPVPLRIGFLLLWLLGSFGCVYFARELDAVVVAGWPLGYWLAAQGGLLFFLALVAGFAALSNRAGAGDSPEVDPQVYRTYKRRLHRRFLLYVVGLLGFVGLMALLEQVGLPRPWLGGLLLCVTLLLYAVIGIRGRTVNSDEYYVAGRRIPAFYNGMATAADWMSAASFISLAGGLYLQGFGGNRLQPGGLAYVLGWAGGFCLVAMLVAPHLRRLQLYTIPDFFQLRFGGRWPRRIAAMAAILCSFTYVVAQIYGVGLITSRLTGVQFEIGILLGLGGVLLCSFLGGMRAVTWTQVVQYAVMLLAFMIPVSWLAYKQLGNPMAPVVYGQQLPKIAAMEQALIDSPAEQQVIHEYARRAAEYERKLVHVARALDAEKLMLQERLHLLREANADDAQIHAVRRELAMLPKDEAAAREQWTRAMQDNLQWARPLAGMPRQGQAFVGDPHGSVQDQQDFELARRNFLALMFCLMIGTAGLPHLLMRFYTTPSEAEARTSVGWSLFFIVLMYVSIPALAVLVKYEVLNSLVGLPMDALPAWMIQWSKVDSGLISLEDVNRDGILQFAELRLGADLVMLVTPELGGLPYVVSGLVAAGGLAAALSTADGLLLTIGNALAHDLGRSKLVRDATGSMRQVILSKFALLLTAMAAAYVAAFKPADILNLVAASFSLAGAAFFPALVLGIFWPRARGAAVVAGMLCGVVVTIFYMAANHPLLLALLRGGGVGLWWGIQPVSAGLFGAAAGAGVIILGSWVLPAGKTTARQLS